MLPELQEDAGLNDVTIYNLIVHRQSLFDLYRLLMFY